MNYPRDQNFWVTEPEFKPRVWAQSLAAAFQDVEGIPHLEGFICTGTHQNHPMP